MKTAFQTKAVTIRMYRPGLGDCFLLTFTGAGDEKRYMMIDCGVLQQTQGEEERLLKIVQDIWRQTGGTDAARGKLHILVATHEHADHLAGFNYHTAVFQKQFDIDEVWMPWTENKDDPKVAELYSTARKTPLDALRSALEEWKKAENSDVQTPKFIKQILDFVSTGQMDCLKTLGKNAPRYLRPLTTPDGPSNIVQRKDFGSVNFHVLGPPENTKDILRGDIPKTKNQMRLGEPLNQVTALTNALVTKNPQPTDDTVDASYSLDLQEIYNLCLPFDQSRAMKMDDAKTDPFFMAHYGFTDSADEGPTWRRIDTDWLEPAAELALDLDSNINNTSLVLAIELAPGGKVLLFAADAQHGSWLSWVNSKKGLDILKRTVFYKVGHHGSNNATLINGGLDQMTQPGLVAMIPVDPVRQPNWNMPNPPLLRRLLRQTNGRLITACKGNGSTPPCACPDVDFALPAEKPDSMTDAEWKQYCQTTEWKNFTKSIQWDQSPERLWVEYTLSA